MLLATAYLGALQLARVDGGAARRAECTTYVEQPGLHRLQGLGLGLGLGLHRLQNSSSGK